MPGVSILHDEVGRGVHWRRLVEAVVADVAEGSECDEAASILLLILITNSSNDCWSQYILISLYIRQ